MSHRTGKPRSDESPRSENDTAPVQDGAPVNSNGTPTGPETAQDQVTTDAPAILLKSRINPDDVVMDQDEQDAMEEEAKGSRATYGKLPGHKHVRAHPSWSKRTYVLDLSDSKNIGAQYVLSKAVARYLIDEENEKVTVADVYMFVDREGHVYFWPVKWGFAPVKNSKPPDHVKTAQTAIQLARQQWVKISWAPPDSDKFGWETRPAQADLSDPVFPDPDEEMKLYLESMDDHYIDSREDQVIQKYLGKV
jgi:hypothetical protein